MFSFFEKNGTKQENNFHISDYQWHNAHAGTIIHRFPPTTVWNNPGIQSTTNRLSTNSNHIAAPCSWKQTTSPSDKNDESNQTGTILLEGSKFPCHLLWQPNSGVEGFQELATTKQQNVLQPFGTLLESKFRRFQTVGNFPEPKSTYNFQNFLEPSDASPN